MIIDSTFKVKLIFYASMVIFISLTFTSILFGQPDKLTRGFDPDGIACGADFGSKEYPYIYFSNPTPTTQQQSICVKKCPKPDSKNAINIFQIIYSDQIIRMCIQFYCQIMLSQILY